MFQFSIRDLMLASALAGIAVSWLVSRAETAELKREINQQKAKALLVDQFIRHAGYTTKGDSSEVILTSKDMKVRSTSSYLDISQRSSGANWRIWSFQPTFPTPSESAKTPW
jgi:hypothetical protein